MQLFMSMHVDVVSSGLTTFSYTSQGCEEACRPE